MNLTLTSVNPHCEVEVRDEPFTLDELKELYPQYDEATIESIFRPGPGHDCTDHLYGLRLHGAAYIEYTETNPGGPACLWGDSDSADAEFTATKPSTTQRSGWALIYAGDGKAHLQVEPHWTGNRDIWYNLHSKEFVEPLLR